MIIFQSNSASFAVKRLLIVNNAWSATLKCFPWLGYVSLLFSLTTVEYSCKHQTFKICFPWLSDVSNLLTMTLWYFRVSSYGFWLDSWNFPRFQDSIICSWLPVFILHTFMMTLWCFPYFCHVFNELIFALILLCFPWTYYVFHNSMLFSVVLWCFSW
jgi:hypothetical protein